METAIREPEKKVLSREQFLTGIKPLEQSFSVPELGGDVVIRPVSLKDREEIKSGSVDGLNRVNEVSFFSLTILKGLVSPKLTQQDIVDLQQGNYGALKRIADKIWAISGIGEADAQKNA